MAASKVTVNICPDYNSLALRAVLLKSFDFLGGLRKFVSPGDKVLLKPNMIAPAQASQAVQTDPAVIIEMAKILLDFGAKPFVADSPAWADVQSCASAMGLAEPLKKLGIPLRQLDRPVKRKLKSGLSVGISAVALEADKIINIPKLKAHQQIVATIAVKNMFGCVSGKAKAIWHFRKGGSTFEFCRMLIEIYELLAPAISLIDAVTVMQGPGPIRGTARRLGRIIASADPIAAEVVCCELIGMASTDLPIVSAAKKLSFGCGNIADVEIVGNGFTRGLITDFDVPPQIPLRFSLPRIIKSIGRQIYLKTVSRNR
ncbi:MAG: DUF362 domain-containing protein [Anaerohalosphaeraceae bacterium]|nr:DUF362 domain-containing protein [Anaerohalosphaeraceae bacterium]